MAASKRGGISARLREKVGPGPFMVADHRTFWLLFGLGLAAFLLLAPANAYGLVYVFGPPTSFLIAAVVFTIYPFRPYRGQPFAKKWSVDKNDPVVMRLVALFESRESSMVMWRAAGRLCGWLLLISAVAALLRHQPLAWNPPPTGQLVPVVGSAIGSYIAVGTEYVGWGLRTWAERETSEHSGE